MRLAYLVLCFLGSWSWLQGQTGSFVDDFSDGNFTSNPTWGGDVGRFVVNASNQLQLNHAGVAATSYLSTPVWVEDSCTWEFFFRLNLAPSSSNFTRIYLQSSNAILTAALNGYYVQIGEAGSDDPIEVFRQTGTTRTSIFRGTLGTVASNPATARLRITRDNAGQWTVGVDYSGGTNFVTEGSFTDNTHRVGRHFGVVCTYTSTNGTNFLFDNFSASPIRLDVQPPRLDSVRTPSGTEVWAYFNEPIQAGPANTVGNYSLTGGLTVNTASLDGTNPQLVRLEVSPSMSSGTTYRLRTQNMVDLAGNVALTDSMDFTYFLVETAALGDVLISEIMARPSPVVGLPNAEYVELHNRSNKVIQLGGMVLNEGSNRILPSHVLLPNAYVIVTANSNVALFQGITTALGVSSMSLTDGGRSITLRTGGGDLVDSVFYRDTWYNDPNKRNGGWSLEMINFNETCKERFNWTASMDAAGGTPGRQNSVFSNVPDVRLPIILDWQYLSATSIRLRFDKVLDRLSAETTGNYVLSSGIGIASAQLLGIDTVVLTLASPMVSGNSYVLTVENVGDCLGNNVLRRDLPLTYYDIAAAVAGDVIFNEVMNNASPVVGLPNAEYVELYNNSNKAIELNSLRLSYRGATASTTTTISLPNLLLLPERHLVLHNSSADSLFSACFNCVGLNLPSLNNTSGFLILRDLGGNLIDSILYDVAWHDDVAKRGGGWSLELVNPNERCKEGANWRSSVNSLGGTPAAINSVFDNTPDTTAPQLTLLRQFSSYQIILELDEVGDVQALSLSSNYNIDGGLQILSAQVLGNNRVLLSLNMDMEDGRTYTLRLSNIGDCVGNLLNNTAFSFDYVETSDANRFDLLINEIMSNPNPPVGLPSVEWLELYNRSNKVINLEGYTLRDNSSTFATLPFYLLRPGEYLLIAGTAAAAQMQGFGPILGLSPFPTLNVSGDDLILRDAGNRIIDVVFYRSNWYQNSSKANGGWTLERINPNQPCQDEDNWRASENPLGGTPNRANSILQTQADRQGPDLLRAFPLSSDSILLYFSEALRDTAANNPANYRLNNGLTVRSVSVQPPLFETVLLRLDQGLVQGVNYTIEARNGVLDCEGNPMGVFNQVPIALPQPIAAGDLLINELLFNPRVGGSDFIEIYNNSGKAVDLRDLIIANTASFGGPINQTQRLTTPYLLFPQDYVAITPDRKNILANYRVSEKYKVLQNSLPSYPDGEGTAVIYTTYGNVPQTIDSFSYDDDFHHALIKDKNGVSLERVSFNGPSNNRNNWHSGAESEGFATPARQNSAFRDNVIDGSDWLQLPLNRLSPDGDGFEDFLLINYSLDQAGFVGNFYIYDAQGRLVKQLSNNELLALEGSLIWDGTDAQGRKCLVGAYVLVAELIRPDGQKRLAKRTIALAGRF